MIEVSDKFKEYCRDKNRIIDAKVLVSEGDEFIEFGKNAIVDFIINQSITNDEDFSIGNVVSSKLEIQLYTEKEIERNAIIKPYIRIGKRDDYSEWLQLGKYRIDTRTKQGSVWKFECYDELIRAQELYKTNLQFPTTSKQMLLEILFNMEYEYDEEFINNLPEYSITRKPGDYSYTYREMLGYIAQMYSSNIIMDNTGRIKFIKVTDRDTKISIQPSEYSGLKQLNEPKIFKKIAANVGGETQQIVIGDGDIDNTLFIENPFVSEEILENIYDDILDYTYVPVDLSNWRGFPFIECGDFIEFIQKDGTSLKTVVQSNTIIFKGGLSGKIKSPAKSFMQSEYGFNGDTSRAINNIKSKIGTFVLAENSSEIKINSRPRAAMMLPITSLDVTDIQVNMTFIGESTLDTTFYTELRGSTGVLGKQIKSKLFQGYNTISVSFLIPALPPLSDNLLLFSQVDAGEFFIEKNNAQVYIYGANLVSGSGLPYAAIEDVLEFEEYINTNDDDIEINYYSPTSKNISGTIIYETYINSDNVQIFIEEADEE